MNRQALQRLADHWVTTVPDPECTCLLTHHNLDGPIQAIDPHCPNHGANTEGSDTMTTQNIPTAPTRKPRTRRRWIAPVATGAAALLIGIGIGSAGNSDTSTAQAAPTPTATVTAEPVVETVTEQVEVTPDACLDYITLAEQVYDISGDAVVAASELDITTLEGATTDIETLTPEIQAAATGCRGY
ncbi:MAG: hypothetical protein QJR09_08095 [Micrococcus sp.]|nr:hypothetical protein [Micrococcus sp.]